MIATPAHEGGFKQIREVQNKDELEAKMAGLNYDGMVEELRRAVKTERLTASYEYRMEQLQNLRKVVVANQDMIHEAVMKDLGRHLSEAFQGETATIIGHVDFALANLKKWMEPETKPTPLTLQLGNTSIVPQPKGVVLNIAPWNYPINLAICPMVEAIAAGNAVVIKPSEMTPNCAEAVKKICESSLDPRICRVVLGDIPETTALLKARWDHIMYTGNGFVGKIVYQAASKYLTPVTLELGGKSPVYVDKSCNLDIAAKRILWAKLINNGQTCVAPDYVLCHEDLVDEFVNLAQERISAMYGAHPQKSDSLARLVNVRHFDRISKLLSENHGGKVVAGGIDGADRADKFIPPTLVVNPNPNSAIMQEEIFGPVLPILTVRDENEAINFINSRESPLALYVFAEDAKIYNKVVDNTESGGSCINDAIFHITNMNAPFGGVGTSGFGSYNGKFGFDEFSHKKTVMWKSTYLDMPRYAPYKEEEVAMLQKVVIGPLIPDSVKTALKVAGGLALAGVVMKARL